jgi:hypothetical protein
MYGGATCDQRLIVKSGSANALIDFNHYFHAGGSARIEWEGIEYSLSNPPTGQERNGSEGDPLLADISQGKVWLVEGSPCLGEGLNLGSIYREALMPQYLPYDHRQPIFRGTSWSIGAYEGSSQSTASLDAPQQLRITLE